VRCLLVLAHGSRRPQSNAEVRGVARTLRARLRGRYDVVAAAFLELARPGIASAIAGAVAAGADEIVLFPYFLSAGRHVSEDIPALVAQARAQFPDVAIHIQPHLGAQRQLAALIAESVP
jgi:sirohydrochlorin ferrochelatase